MAAGVISKEAGEASEADSAEAEVLAEAGDLAALEVGVSGAVAPEVRGNFLFRYILNCVFCLFKLKNLVSGKFIILYIYKPITGKTGYCGYRVSVLFLVVLTLH